MSGGTSVGVISLDLVIKEKLTEQLERIRRTTEQAVSKPFEEAEKRAEEALNETARAAEKAASTAADKVRDVGSETKKAMEKLAEESRAVVEDAAKPRMKYEIYDSAAIQAEMDKITEELTKPKEQAEALTQEMREALGSYEVPTDKVELLGREIELTQEKIGLLQAKWQELQYSLSSADTDEAAAKIVGQINTLESRIAGLYSTIEGKREKINKLTASGAENDLRFEKLREEYELKLEALREKNEEQISGIRERNAARLEAIEKQNAAKIEALEQGKAAMAEKLHAKTARSLNNKVGGAFTKIRRTGSNALGSIKNGFAGVSRAASKLTAPMAKFGNSLKNAARRIFLMAGVLTVFKSVRSAVSEAAKENEEFSKSLNEVKANLAVAFQPIMNAIMPALNELMAGLAAASRQIAAFIAELFGSSYAKAAAQVKKTKELAKEAQKAAAAYLNSYDEMNVAQDNSGKSDSSDSVEDSGTDYSAPDKDVKLPDWAEKLKDSIRKGDWNGVGKLLAEKVNGALKKLDWKKIRKKVSAGAKKLADGLNGFTDSLDWKLLGDSLAEGFNTALIGLDTVLTNYHWDKLGTGLGDLLNGSVKTADWALLGRTIADGLNAAIDTAYGFVTTFDWSGFGTSLSDSVNSFFETADFSKAGATFGETIKGILDTGISFLENTNWQQVGAQIEAFLAKIDWSGIARRIFELLGAALGAAAGLLKGFFTDIVKKGQKYFEDEFSKFDTGNVALDIVLGLYAGIIDAYRNVNNWIYENILVPFIEGIKKGFGISGSGTADKTRKQGVSIMDGLLLGIKDRISALKEKAAEVKDKFLDPLKQIVSFTNGTFRVDFTKAWDGIKQIFSNTWELMVEVVRGPVNKIIDIINGMTSSVAEGFNLVLGGIESVLNNIADTLNSFSIDIPDWVPEYGGNSYGFNIPYADLPSVEIPQIPHLAGGGLVKQPTLAMVGDNPSASTDPEAILPISKLSEMLDAGKLSEVVELLREIVALIRSMDLTVVAKLDDRVLFTAIQQLAQEYKRRTGREAF